MMNGIVKRHVMALAMAGGLLGLAACSDFEAPAVLNELDTYASDINMADFSSSVDAQAVRVDVLLYGLARPSHQPEAPRLSALPADELEAFAARVRSELGLAVRVHP